MRSAEVAVIAAQPTSADGSAAATAIGAHPTTLHRVIRLDAATVLLQWSVGGMAFCWFTTRRRQVGLGYGWMLRGTYLLLGLGALAAAWRYDPVPVRDAATGLFVAAVGVALAVSIVRRKAGVSGQLAEHDRRTARVAAMTGIERSRDDAATTRGREFPPVLDLVPVAFGVVGLIAAGFDAAPDGGSDALVAVLRTLGRGRLPRRRDRRHAARALVPGAARPAAQVAQRDRDALGWIWPIEVFVLLLPPGMFSVFSGAIDDGWGGTLGWFWAACAVTTIVLVFVTRCGTA